MTNKNLIWLHEKSLKYKSFWQDKLGEDYESIHIWDNDYYKKRNYSFQRLVFIYETLCDLEIDIVSGNIITTLQSININKLIIPLSIDTEITKICNLLVKEIDIKFIHDDKFVDIKEGTKFNKFFKYWSYAEKIVFMHNGDQIDEHAK